MRRLKRIEKNYEVWEFDTSDVLKEAEVSDNEKAYYVEYAYTKDGNFIGDEDLAILLCDKKGIVPEIIPPKKNDTQPCCIGFCEREQKWYGWSHRAMYGFGIGYKVKEGDCTAISGWSEEYLKEHREANRALPVGFVARTLDDAKRMAIAFAESVS